MMNMKQTNLVDPIVNHSVDIYPSFVVGHSNCCMVSCSGSDNGRHRCNVSML